MKKSLFVFSMVFGPLTTSAISAQEALPSPSNQILDQAVSYFRKNPHQLILFSKDSKSYPLNTEVGKGEFTRVTIPAKPNEQLKFKVKQQEQGQIRELLADAYVWGFRFKVPEEKTDYYRFIWGMNPRNPKGMGSWRMKSVKSEVITPALLSFTIMNTAAGQILLQEVAARSISSPKDGFQTVALNHGEEYFVLMTFKGEAVQEAQDVQLTVNLLRDQDALAHLLAGN